MILLGSITFLSAFLLFQIELIIAKLFLPSYGGSYLVWGACVVFFQAVLLAGYVAAHQLIERKGIKKYLKIHLAFLCLPFLFFPGRAMHIYSPAGHLPLVLDVFVRLTTTIGPVFLALSTVSLVTQSWLSASQMGRKDHPYVLYAVSNIGSFAALWTYPFIFEYFLPSSIQLNIWRALYLVLVVLNFWAFKRIAVHANKGPFDPNLQPQIHEPVTRTRVIRWLLLSAGTVVLFLSVTNIITYEVAPVPLLWIIPLSVYLLSFVLCFKQRPWVLPRLSFWAAAAVAAGVWLYFLAKVAYLPAAWAILLFNAILFIVCLYGQHELIQSKPGHGQLTLFYVVIALGGFAGGFITSWIVPLISHSPVEFLLGLSCIALAISNKRLRVILSVVVIGCTVLDFFIQPHASIYKKRNYYGIYDVYDKGDVRTLIHGTTLHGLEWMPEQKRFVPLGYYSPFSPLGEIFRDNVFQARRVGAIGLGAGTVAMYSRPGVAMDFFELDPDVVSIAQKYFYYLALAPGPVRVAVGDARVSLAETPDAVYDILIVDAFGGDSIPIHLINKDVLSLYRAHLTPGGAILFHIPSRYFNLSPVLAHIAQDSGALAAVKECAQDGITLHTFWAVLTWDKGKFDRLTGTDGWKQLDVRDYKPMRTWSDDYSTVLPILKFNELWSSLKYFKLFKEG